MTQLPDGGSVGLSQIPFTSTRVVFKGNGPELGFSWGLAGRCFQTRTWMTRDSNGWQNWRGALPLPGPWR